MEGFWKGVWEWFGVALATLLGFMTGELKNENEHLLAAEKQKVKELKTDAKNRDDVAGLSDSQLDDELRNPPPHR